MTAIFLFLDLFLRFLEALSETLLHFLEFEGVGHKHAVGRSAALRALYSLRAVWIADLPSRAYCRHRHLIVLIPKRPRERVTRLLATDLL